MRRAFGAAILLIVAVVGAYAAQDIPDRFNIVRVDVENHRLFIAPAADILATRENTKTFIKGLSSEINRVFPEWGSKWNTSFFSESEYATYKDDDRVLEAVNNGTWSKAYLAEYDHEARKITIAPLNPETTKWYTIE